jgi:2-acylglycerol O-acyltransferase 2
MPSPGHRCIEIFKFQKDVLRLDPAERKRVVDELMVRSDEPFPDNKFAGKSDITLFEEVSVMLFFLIVMGGPLFWFVLLPPVLLLLFGLSLNVLVVYVITTAILALHPMPDVEDPDAPFPKMLRESWFCVALYKYFSYRFAWCGDDFEVCQTICSEEASLSFTGWIGAGPPHGVLPIANVLSMPAVNSFADLRFVGAAASVVRSTPWLRYITLLGTCDVSGKAMAAACQKHNMCVGMVPDGIAGIFQQNEEDEVVFLSNRKGLAKLCLKQGLALVPAYSIGNTTAFDCWFDRSGTLEYLSRKLRMSLFVYWGRFFLPIPYRTNITMLFGAPIRIEKKEAADITQEDIDEVHGKLLSGIEYLFNSHKATLGWGSRKIRFV